MRFCFGAGDVVVVGSRRGRAAGIDFDLADEVVVLRRLTGRVSSSLISGEGVFPGSDPGSSCCPVETS